MKNIEGISGYGFGSGNDIILYIKNDFINNVKENIEKLEDLKVKWFTYSDYITHDEPSWYGRYGRY